MSAAREGKVDRCCRPWAGPENLAAMHRPGAVRDAPCSQKVIFPRFIVCYGQYEVS